MCVLSLFLLLPVLQAGASGVLSKSAPELLPQLCPESWECVLSWSRETGAHWLPGKLLLVLGNGAVALRIWPCDPEPGENLKAFLPSGRPNLWKCALLCLQSNNFESSEAKGLLTLRNQFLCYHTIPLRSLMCLTRTALDWLHRDVNWSFHPGKLI